MPVLLFDASSRLLSTLAGKWSTRAPLCPQNRALRKLAIATATTTTSVEEESTSITETPAAPKFEKQPLNIGPVTLGTGVLRFEGASRPSCVPQLRCLRSARSNARQLQV